MKYLKLVSLFGLLFLFCGCASTPQYTYQETRDLIKLVNLAVTLINQKGEAAFTELRQPNSQWNKGDQYLFVWDTNFIRTVYPPAPEQEENSVAKLKDLFTGKPIGQMLTSTALNNKDGGWVHYLWPKPDNTYPDWKSSFVKLAIAPSGKKYIVGSGLYDMKMERVFVSQMVDEAVQLIETDGRKALDILRDSASKFIFKDTYVFVITEAGIDLVNPGFPKLEGKNILNLTDTKGQLFVRKFFEVAKKQGTGWVDYMWPKPGDKKPVLKSAYIKKAQLNGKTVVVGCGVYLD